MALMSREDAQRIEQEAHLARGTMSYGREKSIAEDIYLGVPPNPMLAIHVDFRGGHSALVIYEQAIGKGTKSYLSGAEHATEEDAMRDVKRTWGALVSSRQNGLFDSLKQEVSVVFTGWSDVGKGQRWSWSVAPSRLRNIFSSAPNSLLLCPRFEDWPPEYEGGPSPGKFLSRLGVDQVVFVYSIFFQGVTTLALKSAGDLVALAAKLAAE